MGEVVRRIKSVYLGNERSVWIREPADPAGASLIFFLDGELYRERLGAASIIDELVNRECIGDSWFVFVSMHSDDARWVECPCHPPYAKFIANELSP